MGKSIIGNRIRKARKWADLDRPTLAAAVGVTEGSVARWETGGAEPTPANLEQIAAATGVPLDWFDHGGPLPEEPVPPGFTDGVRYALARVQKLAEKMEDEAERGALPSSAIGERLEDPDD